MKVGFYSPLPPARTGVADYAAALLAELRRRGPVEVDAESCDIALYHLGNNALHAGIYQRALDRPGVIVLHDAVLHHFLLGQLNETAYVNEFVYNYGEWTRGLAGDLWRGRAASGSDDRYFRRPMLKRIVERAKGVVVHNPAAGRAVLDHFPDARMAEIPHLFMARPMPTESEAVRYRQSLGVPADATLFGVFGYLRESKRLVTVVDAFTQLHREFPRTALLVAGEFVSSDLERAVGPLLHGPGVVRRRYLPEREFWLAAQAIDVCVNLRYPAAGESSGIAVRMMGAGKAVMVTDSEEYARVPEGACIRIPAGTAERDSLFEHMVLVTSIQGVAAEIGKRGAGHIEAFHRVETVGKQYWNFLCESCT